MFNLIFCNKYLKFVQKAYDIIIGCDSMIEFNGLILGKPIDNKDAFETLKKFLIINFFLFNLKFIQN